MSNTVTTTELLSFFANADKVASHVTVVDARIERGYKIVVHCDWDSDGDVYPRSTFITDDGEYLDKYGYQEFNVMYGELDFLAKEHDERELKKLKRQRLIDSLTDEEKELLGVK